MSDLFLQKEQELLKLNEEINVKTKTVLQKTEKNGSKGGVRKTVSRKKSEDREAKKSAKEVNVPSTSVAEETVESEISSAEIIVPKKACSDAIPERMARKNVSSEGLIKFLKAKVSILQDEVDTHQKDSLKNSEQLQALQESQKNLESVRDQLTNKLNVLHSQQKKLEARNEELELKLKNRDVDLTKQSRDLEASRRESKTLAQEKSTLERKLLKSQEDHESTKQSLASAYEREKEMRERTRMEKDAYEKQVRQLRKQRLNLIGAYKQQLLLLDNLKRQIVCLEEAKMIDFAEKEFTKILDWGK